MSAGVSAIRIAAKGNHTASVIMLHGLGDSGRGWAFVSQFYDYPHVKV
jgi:predicted esterase